MQNPYFSNNGILVSCNTGIDEGKMATWVAFELICAELYQLKDAPPRHVSR